LLPELALVSAVEAGLGGFEKRGVLLLELGDAFSQLAALGSRLLKQARSGGLDEGEQALVVGFGLPGERDGGAEERAGLAARFGGVAGHGLRRSALELEGVGEGAARRTVTRLVRSRLGPPLSRTRAPSDWEPPPPLLRVSPLRLGWAV
jgi:hypothetical protein